MSKWKYEGKVVRRYVKKWEQRFKWVTLLDDKCYCQWCKCSLTNMKTTALGQHERSAKHKRVVQLRTAGEEESKDVSMLTNENNTGRQYVKQYGERFRWLTLVDNKCYCDWCKCSLSFMTKSGLEQHEKAAKHRKAQNMREAFVKPFTTKVEPVECGEVNAVAELDTLSESCHGVVQPAHIGFIGCGIMAQALLNGFIRNGLVEPTKVIASSPSDKNLSKVRSLGITTTFDNDLVVASSDLIFLSIKSEVLESVVKDLKPIEGNHNPLFVSVIGGFTTHDLEMMLLPVTTTPRVIRALLNTPSMISHGCCVYSLGSEVAPEEGHVVQELLSSIGVCEMVPEDQINAAEGLSTCGPAYIFIAIEALADGGVKMGLSRKLAHTLAAQTVKGAAAMVMETGKHPAQLKDEVCLPGGTAIAAVHTLEKAGIRSALISAVEASANKSKDIEIIDHR